LQLNNLTAPTIDSSGLCGHAVTENEGYEIRLGYGADCEDGGINVAPSRDDKSAIRLDRIRISDRDKSDHEAREHARGRCRRQDTFRVDRADAEECAELVTDRRELAAIGYK
jgi:hypothetical protein